MSKFYSKKIRHRCSIPGCRCTSTTLFSASREFAAAVYLCDEHIRLIGGRADDVQTDDKKATVLRRIAEIQTMTQADLRDIAAALGYEDLSVDLTREQIRAIIRG